MVMYVYVAESEHSQRTDWPNSNVKMKRVSVLEHSPHQVTASAHVCLRVRDSLSDDNYGFNDVASCPASFLRLFVTC